MYFTKVENPKFYKPTKLYVLLEQFHESGMRVAKVEDWHYVDAHSGRGSIRRAAKRFGFNSIIVTVRNGEIYLINENIAEG